MFIALKSSAYARDIIDTIIFLFDDKNQIVACSDDRDDMGVC